MHSQASYTSNSSATGVKNNINNPENHYSLNQVSCNVMLILGKLGTEVKRKMWKRFEHAANTGTGLWNCSGHQELCSPLSSN